MKVVALVPFSLMKTDFLSVICKCVFIVLLLAGVPQQVFAQFSGGSGTASDPYQVATANDLNNVRDYMDKYFIQTVNVDLSSYSNWNPIGTESGPFRGFYDGNDYTISNLSISRGSEKYIGLFGFTNQAILNNIGLVNVDVTGDESVGALLGKQVGGMVYNSFSTGEVNGLNFFGGLVGRMETNARVLNSHSSCTVLGGETDGDWSGGLVGYIFESTISYSYASGSTTGQGYVGGLVGNVHHDSNVSNSYATGNVTGIIWVGGLTGSFSGYISDSYATGIVEGRGKNSAFIGVDVFGIIRNSYGVGHVITTGDDPEREPTGGLIGTSGYTNSAEAEAYNSFWDKQTTNQTESAGGISKTTSEMKSQSTFTDWDFTNTWVISSSQNSGYPYLRPYSNNPPSVSSVSISGNNTIGSVATVNYSYSDPNNEEEDGTIYKWYRANDSSGNGEALINGASGKTYTITSSDAGKYIRAVVTPNDGIAFGDPVQNNSLFEIIPFDHGNGTSGDPYEVTTYEHLDYIRNYSSSYFIQKADIDLSPVSNWYPIDGFSGTFDGNRYTISNLTIDRSSTENVGLFGYGSGTLIRVGLENVSVIGASNTGGLYGFMGGGNISESYVSGSVSGGTNTGGLVGQLSGTAYKTYSTASVEGGDNVGSLVGINKNGTVDQSYAVGAVTGSGSKVLGLVGNESGGSTGASYWDKETTGKTSSYGGSGKVTAEMKTQSTFTGWDFSNTWAIESGATISYPYLRNSVPENIPGSESGFSGGAGTESDPYKISTVTQLNRVRNVSDAYFKLTANIALSSISNWDPIDSFSGSFDGNGYTISNLTINRSSTENVGLFGYGGGMLSKVALENVSIIGGGNTGGLYGFMTGGSISESYTTGSVTGSSNTGGLVGQLQATVNNSYSLAAVDGGTADNIGALVGQNRFGSVTNSYAVGSVSGSGDRVLGFIGYDYGGSSSSSYWDKETTGKTSSYGGTGKTTAEMKHQSTFSGWNFTEIWAIESDVYISYPYLRNAEPDEKPGYVENIPFEGEGTSENPYQITSAELLSEVRNYLDAHYVLAGDIDLSSISNWNPISIFTGFFDGNGYTISNLTIDRATTNNVGLFGYVDGGTLTGIALENVDVTGQNNTGGLVGSLASGSISKSYVSGTIVGGDITGGLVGFNSGSISSSYAIGSVSGTDATAGLVGYNNGGSTDKSFAVASVSGSGSVGGLVALVRNGATVTDSYWDTEVSGQSGGEGGTGKTTLQMKSQDTFANWEFSDTWTIINSEYISYPYLQNSVPENIPGSELGFAGGLGTEAEPYEISTPIQLERIRNVLDAYYKLTADIDLASISNWDPIDNFSGNLSGNGYTISNLTIDRSSEDNIGLFGYSGGVLTGIALENVEVSGKNNTGGLVGFFHSGSITESYVSGDIAGGDVAGGLTGFNSGAISSSYVIGAVSGTDASGGLVGYNNDGSIEESYSTASVSGGGGSVGGLVALVRNGATVTDSYWDTEVSGQSGGEGGTGKTSAEMKNQSTFTSWDFNNTWTIESGDYFSYPYLRNTVPDEKPGLEEAPEQPIFNTEENKAISFNSNGYISLDGQTGLSASSSTDNFSIAMWIKATGTDQALFGEFANGHSHTRNYLTINGSGQLAFDQWEPSDGTTSFDTAVNAGEWVHVVYVQGSDTRKAYVNGTLESTIGSAEAYSGSTPDQFYLGYRGGSSSGNNFTGEMDEVSWWSKALSSSEISELYEGTINQEDASLLGYLSFDESESTNITAAVGNTDGSMANGMDANDRITGPEVERTFNVTILSNATNGIVISDSVIQATENTPSFEITDADGGPFSLNSEGKFVLTRDLAKADTGSYNLSFKVTLEGVEYTSEAVINIQPYNALPIVSGVVISGEAKVYSSLTGSYNFSDEDGEEESGSTYKWYSASDTTGLKTQISGATDSTYTITSSEQGKYLQFVVFPHDGNSAGDSVSSTWVGPVILNDPPSITSVIRQNPSTETIEGVEQVTFRVAFNKPVAHVDTSDFEITGTAFAELESVTTVSDSLYDIVLSDVGNESATLGLAIKGTGSIGGSNNIVSIQKNIQTTASQHSTDDWLSQSELGQSFKAGTSDLLNSVTVYTKSGNHNFEGTATLTIYSGIYNQNDPTELTSQTISIANTIGAQTFSINDKPELIQGEDYSFVLSGFSGSGYALEAYTGSGYANGQVYFTGMNNTTHKSNFDLKFEVEEGSIQETGSLLATAPGVSETYKIENNSAPVASNVSISGAIKLDSTIFGSYDFSDVDGDDNAGAKFQWYSFDDNTGANRASINGATDSTYTISRTDAGSYLRLAIIPFDGTAYGDTVWSSYQQMPEIADLFAGGAGTEADPYQITTPEEMNHIRYVLDAHYELQNDIDLDVAPYNEGEGWEPVGTYSDQFTGTLDGNAYTISGLFINRSLEYYQGLFGVVDDAVITGLTLDEVDVTGSGYTGALVGEFNGISSEISYVAISGNVTGTSDYIGGLVGYQSQGSITNVVTSGAVAGGDYTSGLVGIQSGGSIDQAFTNVAVDGPGGYEGGLLAYSPGGFVTNSFWNTDSTATSEAGTGLSTSELNDQMSYNDAGWDFSSTWYISQSGTPALVVLSGNTRPVVSNVSVSGTLNFGDTLLARYDFSDVDGDEESGSTYKWYSASDTTGAKTQISGATDTTFTLTASEIGKYIQFVVIPNDGISEGNSVASAWVGLVEGITTDKNALAFDGIDDRITISDNAAFDFSNGFSAEAWINPTEIKEQVILAQHGGTDSENAFLIKLTSGGAISASLTTTNNQTSGYHDYSLTSSETISAGEWSHIAVSSDNNTLKISINGNEIDSQDIRYSFTISMHGTCPPGPGGLTTTCPPTSMPGFASSVVNNVSTNIEIGSGNDAQFFGGAIDEVSIWGKALSSSDISNQMNYRKYGNEAGLIIYYDFNQGASYSDNSAITLIEDISNNNLDGTLSNFSNEGISSNFVLGAQQGTFTDNYTQVAPIAENVIITGALELDQVLTGDYDYSDANDDLENGSEFKWYSASDTTQGKTLISDATGTLFTLKSSEVGKFIQFEVIPNDGNAAGESYESAWVGPVTGPEIPVFNFGENKAISFNSNGYISLDGQTGISASNASDNFSIAMWIKATGTDQALFGEFANGHSHTRNYLTINGSGQLAFDQWEPSGGTTSFDTAVNTGEWVHVVYVQGSDTRKAYVNGTQESTIGSSEAYSGNTPNQFYLGYRGGSSSGNNFTGEMDEVSWWNKALSSSEITDLYAGTINQSDANLLGYLSFDDSETTSITTNVGDNNGSMENGMDVNDRLSGLEIDKSFVVNILSNGLGGAVISDSVIQATENTPSFQITDADGGPFALNSAGKFTLTRDLTRADTGSYNVSYEVALDGEEYESEAIINIRRHNTMPEASDVAINGTVEVGKFLNATYDYTDPENDLNAGATFLWYRADDNSGTNETSVGSSADSTYTIGIADIDKYVRVAVIPNDGTAYGDTVWSGYVQMPDISELFAGGTGTEENPYLVSNAEQLNNVRLVLDGYFRQTADIDLGAETDNSEGLYWNGGKGWESIGDFAHKFTGSYDGDGHVIQGLFINRSTSSSGLFGRIDGAEITQLGLAEVDITSETVYGGGIAAYSGSSNISESYVEGIITTSGSNTKLALGGLVGILDESSLSNNFTNVRLNGGDHQRTGGMVGVIYSGSSISNSYAAGAVTGERIFVGFGMGSSTSVSNSFRNTDSTATSSVGSSSTGTGLTTAEMQTQSIFTDAGWDFGSIWYMGESGYPELTAFSGNTPPVASNVSVSGELKSETTLTATYDYSDIDNNDEEGSEYTWYTAIDTSGTKSLISGAESASYTLTDSEIGKYVRFTVIPKDGIMQGDSKSSTWLGPVELYDPPVVTSVTRQDPAGETIKGVDQVVFRVIFDKPVTNVDTTDFEIIGLEAANFGSVSVVSDSVYDVSLTNIPNENGSLGLAVNGTGSTGGSNNITGIRPYKQITASQLEADDWLGQSALGQSFVASTSDQLSSITIYTQSGKHSFEGTATLTIYSGTYNEAGTAEITSQTVSITNEIGAQSFIITNKPELEQGETYSFIFSDFSGTGYSFSSYKNAGYSDGQVYFTGMNSSTHPADFDLKFQVEEARILETGSLLSTAPGTSESYTVELNAIPEVTNVAINGTPWAGNELTATYDYSDSGNVAESGSTFQWYIADDNTGGDSTAIAGATEITYTPKNEDVEKFIAVEVTPSNGIITGEVILSSWVQVEEAPEEPVILNSITRIQPADSVTNVDFAAFLVSFNDSVKNVDVSDFTLTGTTATISVTPAFDTNPEEYKFGEFNPAVDSLNSIDSAIVNYRTLAETKQNDLKAHLDSLDTQYDEAVTDTATLNTELANLESQLETAEAEHAEGIATDLAAIDEQINEVNESIEYTEQYLIDHPDDPDAPLLLTQLNGIKADYVAQRETILNTGTEDITSLNEQIESKEQEIENKVAQIYQPNFFVLVEGEDLAELNTTISLSLNSSNNIEDRANNGVLSSSPAGLNEHTLTFDNSAPVLVLTKNTDNDVLSIAEQQAGITLSGTVNDSTLFSKVFYTDKKSSHSVTVLDGTWSLTLNESELADLATADSVILTFDAFDGLGNAAEQLKRTMFLEQNTAPIATSVNVNGTLTVDSTLSASYNFSDSDEDEESGSAYKWYAASDTTAGKTQISGANDISYTLTDLEEGKYIQFVVFPNDGTTFGDSAASEWMGPVHKPRPEIVVKGNGNEIASGDDSSNSSDSTYVGVVSVADSMTTVTYYITNTGDVDLILGNNPVSLSGTHASDFTVSVQPDSAIAYGDSTFFTIIFDPSDAGIRETEVSISSNDEDENPFTFVVEGTGNAIPQIAGAVANQQTDEDTPIAPFSAVTLADTEGDNISVVVTLDENMKGLLTGDGFTGIGPYTLSSQSVADAQAALQALEFDPGDNRVFTGDTETTTFYIRVSDNWGTYVDSITTVISTAINDAPVATISGGTTFFAEGSGSVVIDDGVGISDSDNTSFFFAEVHISAGFQMNEDSLGFTNDGTTMGNIQAEYNRTTGVLTLSSADTSATSAEFQSALRAVTYDNISQAPDTENRTISFTINDGLDSSTAGTQTISLTDTNNAPLASGVAISGSFKVDSTLIASYSFHDAEGDEESGSTYKWYIANDTTEARVQISGAADSTFTLTAAEKDNYIQFEVTPDDGTETGTSAASSWYGPVYIPLWVEGVAASPDTARRVAIDSVLTINFNQTITEENVSGVSISSSSGSTVSEVNASVTDSAIVITHDDFEPGIIYALEVPAGAISIGNGETNETINWTFRSLLSAPEIVSIFPPEGAGGVFPTAQFYYTFDQEISTVDTNGITIIDTEGQPVSGLSSHVWDEDMYKLQVDYSNLEHEASYTAIIPPGVVRNEDDVVNADSIITSFVTRKGPLVMEHILPADESTSISIDSTISVKFNYDIEAFTNVSDITLKNAEGASAGNISVAIIDSSIAISHDVLDYATEYTVTIPGSAITNGAYHNDEVSWSFTTVQAQPVVEALYPEDNAVGIALDSVIAITFDKEITEGNLSGITIQDTTGTSISNIEATLSGRTITISHDDFSSFKKYIVTIPAGAVENEDGLPNEEATWSFNTLNSLPVAENVAISGTLHVDSTLIASYDFGDADGDTESGSTYQWHIADDNSGTGAVALNAAVDTVYTLTSSESGKYIRFEVIPNDGNEVGEATLSAWQGPITTPSSQIVVKGNGIEITNGDSTPADADSTFFGEIGLVDSTVSVSYYIHNTGNDILETGENAVSMSGPAGSDFTVIVQPDSEIAPGDSSLFTLLFNPSDGGLRSAQVSITHNDADENPFTFTINGTGVSPTPVAADVSISGNLTTGEVLVGNYTYISEIEEEGSSYQWYIADDNTGSNASLIDGAMGTGFTLTNAQIGKYIRFEVTPAHAYEEGSTAASGWIGPVNDLLSVNRFTPQNGAENVAIESVLSVKFNQVITEVDLLGIAIKDSQNTEVQNVSASISDSTISITHDDLAYEEVYTASLPANAVVSNSNDSSSALSWSFTTENFVPVASDVTIEGILHVGKSLQGSYTYFDKGGDTETGSTYQWFVADDNSGSNAIAISNATATNYMLTANESGKFIGFEVVPNDGIDAGKAAKSTWLGPIITPEPEILVLGNQNEILSGDDSPVTADSTDFEKISIADTSAIRIFNIVNTGIDTLVLGENAVSISGTQAAGFYVSVQPEALVLPDDTTTFAIRFDPSDSGVHKVTVSITNNDPDENPYLFDVQGFGVNTAPVITSISSVNIEENNTEVVTVTATDKETPTALTFSITGGADQNAFSINEAGILSFKTAPDFENAHDLDENNVYELTVQVSDGDSIATQNIEVGIADANETAPEFTSVDAVTMNENATTVLTVSATDADTSDTISYAINDGADATHFTINTNSGMLSFSSAPNFESPQDGDGNHIYEVTVLASDGENTTSQSLEITIEDVNEFAPVFTSASNVKVYEHPALGALVATILAEDKDSTAQLSFGISSNINPNGNGTDAFALDAETGALTVTDPDDFNKDENSSFSVEIMVSDGDSSAVQVLNIAVASAPVVAKTSPEDEALAIALDTDIEIHFDQQVKDVDLAQVQIIDADENSVNNIQTSLTDTVLVISHDGFSNNMLYTITIPEGVVANADDVANKAFEFSFTSIKAAPDFVALNPADGEKAVELDEVLTVQFDQDITETDLSGISIVDENDKELSELTTSISDRILAIAHPAFENHTSYTVTIPTGSVQNTDGVENAEFEWSFRSVMKAPSILTLNPEADADQISIDHEILITFDQPLLEGELSEVTISDEGGSLIAHEAEIVEDSSISISHDGFENLTTYTLTIPSEAVLNEDSVGNAETQWSFTTIVSVPGEVVLSLPQQGEGSVELNPELSWISAERAEMYSLEISSDSLFIDNILTTKSGISETKFKVADGLEYYQDYYWRARAENDGGNGEWSDVGRFVTKAETPGQLFPIDGAEKISTAPKVQWLSDHDQTEFNFHLSTSATFETLVFDTMATDAEVMLSGLEANESYFWKVRILNQETTSDWSSVWSFTTRPDPEDEEDEPVDVNITFGETSSDKGGEDGGETKEKPGSVDVKDYQLVSLPGTDQIRLDEFFEGKYDKEWRAFVETGRTVEFYDEYTPEDNRFIFRPGMGFWVLSKKIVAGEYLFTPVATNKNDAFGIPVHDGWNIIGNPYQSNVEWKLVQELNTITSSIYGYDQQFVEVDTMKVLGGYYFYNSPELNMDTLFIPYTGFEQRGIEADSTAGSSKGFPKLLVQATLGKNLKTGIEIVYSDSAEQHEMGLTKYHPGVERASYGMVMNKDGDENIEHKMKRGVSTYNAEGELYHLQIKSEVGSRIKMNTTFEDMPEDARILLVNSVTHEAQMIKSGEDHEVLTSEPVSRFKLYVGDEAALQEIEDALLPDQVELRPNYPNPFNPSTTINYALTENTDVRIVVYDILGRKVATLIDGPQKAGWHKVRFDGSRLASGVYLYRLKAGNTMRLGKMTLIK